MQAWRTDRSVSGLSTLSSSQHGRPRSAELVAIPRNRRRGGRVTAGPSVVRLRGIERSDRTACLGALGASRRGGKPVWAPERAEKLRTRRDALRAPGSTECQPSERMFSGQARRPATSAPSPPPWAAKPGMEHRPAPGHQGATAATTGSLPANSTHPAPTRQPSVR
jgi:hypothetical protein